MKKSVKFIAVLLIVLQMFTLCSSCFADAGEKVEFEPVVIPLFKSTLNEWYFDNYARALFIAALATDLDFHLQAENKGTFNTVDAVSNSAYIGKNNSNLIVYMDDNKRQVIVVYDFLTDTAAYMYADDYSEIEVQLVLNDLCDSYYEIDSDDLAAAASDLFTKGSFAETATQSEPAIYTSGDYEYILLEDGTAEITEYRGESSKVDIPEKLDGYVVTSIGETAFERRLFLNEITIPDSVTSIGDCAFFGCESLTEIVIPDSVTSIGDNPFSVCLKLTKIEVSPDHPTLEKIDGVLFDKREKKLICYPFTLTAESYSIPQGIFSIGGFAFYCCESLTEITIPDSVTSIGELAFFGCVSLTEITIPDSVTSIETGAFVFCDSLTVTVERESYAEIYAKENSIEYTYTDATTGFVDFKPQLVPFFDATIIEWYENSDNRTLFAVALASDLGVYLESENKGTVNMANAVFNPAYIGKKGFTLVVYVDDDTRPVCILYDFLQDTASYMYVDGPYSEIVVQLTLEDTCDSYYKIDSDDLLEVFLELIKLFT